MPRGPRGSRAQPMKPSRSSFTTRTRESKFGPSAVSNSSLLEWQPHEKVLPYDGDRLRQQQAPSRNGLREGDGGHHRAFQEARGLRHPFRDGQRRAFPERLQERGGARRFAAPRLRTPGGGVSVGLATTRRVVRRLPPNDRGPPPPSGAGFDPEDSRRGRRLRGHLSGLVPRLVRGIQAGERRRGRKLSPASHHAPV